MTHLSADPTETFHVLQERTEEFQPWLSPFLEALGNKTRRRCAQLYLTALLGAGRPKRVKSISSRLGLKSHDQLHHFLTSTAWDDMRLWSTLGMVADQLVGGDDAVLVLRDAVLPKRGASSVGVAVQSIASAGGRSMRCQILSLQCLASESLAVPVSARLLLPEEWSFNERLCKKAGIPEYARRNGTRTAAGLDQIDRLRASGVRFGTVCADEGYVADPSFADGLAARNLSWMLQLPGSTHLSYVVRAHGRDAALHRQPENTTESAEAGSLSVETLLSRAGWRPLQYDRGTHHPLAGEVTACRLGARARHLDGSGTETWLIREQGRHVSARYFHVRLASEACSGLSESVVTQRLSTMLEANLRGDQVLVELGRDFGLGDFEGRGWVGFHRHALMASIAYCYRASFGRG